jgi:hypothetical protein
VILKRMAVAVVAISVAGTMGVGAEAAKKPKKVKRKATATYDTPAVGSGDATGVCSGANGCATFGIGAGERFLHLEIEDSAGLPVYATVGQDTDPSNNFTEVVGRICGSTQEPLPIEPGIEVLVWVWVAPGAQPPCAGTATTGTVTATISNLP